MPLRWIWLHLSFLVSYIIGKRAYTCYTGRRKDKREGMIVDILAILAAGRGWGWEGSRSKFQYIILIRSPALDRFFFIIMKTLGNSCRLEETVFSE
jgi:hypothetical protein